MLGLFNGFKTLQKLMEGQKGIGTLGQWEAGLTAQIGKIALGIQGWFEGLKTAEDSPGGAPQLG